MLFGGEKLFLEAVLGVIAGVLSAGVITVIVAYSSRYIYQYTGGKTPLDSNDRDFFPQFD